MAKRKFTRIDSFLAFRAFDRKAEQKYKDEYKQRTGKENARGWNHSKEFDRFQKSRAGRVVRYAENNPESFLKYSERVFRRGVPGATEKETFAGDVKHLDTLNPMKTGTGAIDIIEQARALAKSQGKRLIIAGEYRSELLPGGKAVITGEQSVIDARNEMMRAYGAGIAAGQAAGSYQLIGANYSYQLVSSGSNLLLTIEQENFFY